MGIVMVWYLLSFALQRAFFVDDHMFVVEALL
jgi:hypothetical protein